MTKRFKNGNLTVRFDHDIIEQVNAGTVSPVEALSWELEGKGCYFIGESYCLSNYEEGATVYNCFSDVCYVVNFTDVAAVLMAGKTMRLYARTPDETDREIMESEGF